MNAAEMFTSVSIVEDAIDANRVISLVNYPEIGGMCFFIGVVRGLTQKDDAEIRTDYLVFEAYRPMAEQKLQQIADEIREQFPRVRRIAITQRIGRLEVGDIAVIIACATEHRNEDIFSAARYGIDRLKEIVPVWKQENGAGQSVWVEGSYHPPTEAPQEVNL